VPIGSQKALATGLTQLHTLTTIFLGIFIEAVPFLLAGSLLAGFLHVFVDPKGTAFSRLPRHPVLASLAGGLMGLVFPVCECGVVPVVRRLQQKGLPISTSVAFMLAGPAVNPVVIAGTYTAFGWGPILAGRILLSLAIGTIVGLIFSLAKPEQLLLPNSLGDTPCGCGCEGHPSAGARGRVGDTLAVAGNEFLDMVRYLIFGSLLAAGMQTLVPQSTLLALAEGAVGSVLALQALAFSLSVCSTVDAFVALSFASSFAPGAILGFLVFGPMVDLKSSLMFLGVFRKRAVVYLILLPFLMTLSAGIALNLLGVQG